MSGLPSISRRTIAAICFFIGSFSVSWAKKALSSLLVRVPSCLILVSVLDLYETDFVTYCYINRVTALTYLVKD